MLLTPTATVTRSDTSAGARATSQDSTTQRWVQVIEAVADVELATLGWVHWHNTSRLHGYLDDLPPSEFEATFYATKRTDQPLVEIQ